MKKTVFLMLALAFTLAASAQQDGRGRRERMSNMDLAELNNRQATRLAKQMKLSDEVEQKFIVLYLDYQNARHNAANPTGGDQEGAEQRVDINKLSDEQASDLIQKNFDRQERQLAVDRQYLPRFLEILSPSQAAHIFLQRGGQMRGGQMRGGNGQRGPRGGGGPRGGFGGGDFGGGGF